jgi:integrase
MGEGETLMKPKLRIVPPSTVNRSVASVSAPGRAANSEYRDREHLTPEEVHRLIETAKRGRHGLRDAALILMVFRHGLRAQEVCDLKWSEVQFGRNPTVFIRRVKGSDSGAHPLRGDEQRMLRELHRQYPDSAYVFTTEREGPFTTDAINRLIKRIGDRAKLSFPIHVHMLRHACGYALANDGYDTRAIQGWLGHKQIQNTVGYTKLSPKRFEGIWGKSKMY